MAMTKAQYRALESEAVEENRDSDPPLGQLIDRNEYKAAVAGVEAWWETQRPLLNQQFPLPARGVLPMREKVRILEHVVRAREGA